MTKQQDSGCYSIQIRLSFCIPNENVFFFCCTKSLSIQIPVLLEKEREIKDRLGLIKKKHSNKECMSKNERDFLAKMILERTIIPSTTEIIYHRAKKVLRKPLNLLDQIFEPKRSPLNYEREKNRIMAKMLLLADEYVRKSSFLDTIEKKVINGNKLTSEEKEFIYECQS